MKEEPTDGFSTEEKLTLGCEIVLAVLDALSRIPWDVQTVSQYIKDAKRHEVY